MSYRFYMQQLERTGNCPGLKNPRKRKRKVAWTDEKREAVIEAYKEREPTPETSVEIVGDLAEEFEESANGVRMILTRAGVYVKKSAEATKKPTTNSTSTRVSKADAIATLTAAITENGGEVDEAIVSKLTGKAALYFANLLSPAEEA